MFVLSSCAVIPPRPNHVLRDVRVFFPGLLPRSSILCEMAWPLPVGSADTKQIATDKVVRVRQVVEGKQQQQLLVQGCQTPKCRITTVVYRMLYVSGSRWGAGEWWWWWSEDRSSPAAGVAESAILLP